MPTRTPRIVPVSRERPTLGAATWGKRVHRGIERFPTFHRQEEQRSCGAREGPPRGAAQARALASAGRHARRSDAHPDHPAPARPAAQHEPGHAHARHRLQDGRAPLARAPREPHRDAHGRQVRRGLPPHEGDGGFARRVRPHRRQDEDTPMTAVGMLSLALAALNCLLAIVLGAVYWRNHRDIRSPFTLGLLLFALFLVVHNALVVYRAFAMMTSGGAFDEGLLLVEELLQTGASGAL